eukprot:9850-Chlamydomonas_euryale.AAC.3
MGIHPFIHPPNNAPRLQDGRDCSGQHAPCGLPRWRSRNLQGDAARRLVEGGGRAATYADAARPPRRRLRTGVSGTAAGADANARHDGAR